MKVSGTNTFYLLLVVIFHRNYSSTHFFKMYVKYLFFYIFNKFLIIMIKLFIGKNYDKANY